MSVSLLGNDLFVGTGSATVSGSYTCNAGANRKLLVWCSSENAGGGIDVSTVTYNGVALTKVQNDVFGFNQLAFFYLDEADFPTTPGSYTLAATFTAAADPGFVSVLELEDALQGAPSTYSYTSIASSASINQNVTTQTEGGALCCGLVGGSTGWTFSGASGQTILDQADGGGGGSHAGHSIELITDLYTTTQASNFNTSATVNRLQQGAAYIEQAGIACVNVSSNTAPTGSTITLAVPTGTIDGDLMLAFLVEAVDDEWASVPSGWTLYVDEHASGDPEISIYWKIASSEPSDYNWASITAGIGLMGAIASYRRVNETQPFDVLRTLSTGTGDPDPPNITTVTDDTRIVAVGFSDGDDGYSALSAGYDPRVPSLTVLGTGNGASLGVCDFEAGGAGSYDPGTFTPVGAGGPPTVVNSAQATASSTTTLTFAYTVSAGSNRKLVVFTGTELGGSTDPTVTSVTYNGTALTFIANQVVVPGTGTFRNNVSGWYLDDASFPTPGTYNIVVTYGQTANDIIAHVVELSGAEQGAPTFATSTATSSASITTNVTVADDDSILLGSVECGDGGTTFTPGSGQTLLQDTDIGGSANSHVTGSEIVSSGSQASTWNLGGAANRLAQLAVAIGPASGVSTEEWGAVTIALRFEVGGAIEDLAAAIQEIDQVLADLDRQRGVSATIEEVDQVLADLDRQRGIAALVQEIDQVTANILRSRSVSATIEEIDQVLAALDRARAIAATIEEIDQVTAALDRARGIAATIEEIDQVLAVLEVARGLSASIQEVDQVTALLERGRGLSAAIQEVDQVLAVLLRSRAVAASIQEVDQVLADLQVTIALTATIQEIDQVLAALDRARGLSATIEEIDQVLAALDRARGFSATIEEIDQVLAALGVTRPLAATIQEIDQLTAALTRAIGLSATIEEIDRVLANLNRARGLSATIEEIDQVLANLDRLAGLSATIEEVDQVTAALTRARQVAASIQEIDQVTAALTRARGLSASIQEIDNLLANLEIGGEVDLSATIQELDRVVANLNYQASLAALVEEIDQVTAALNRDRGVSATIQEIDQVLAALARERPVSATIQEIDQVTATLARIRGVSATIQEIDQVLANLSRLASLSATIEEVDRVTAAITRARGISTRVQELDRVLANLIAQFGVSATIQEVDRVLASLDTGEEELAALIQEIDQVLAALGVARPLATTIEEIDQVAADIDRDRGLATAIEEVDQVDANLNAALGLSTSIEEIDQVRARLTGGLIQLAANIQEIDRFLASLSVSLGFRIYTDAFLTLMQATVAIEVIPLEATVAIEVIPDAFVSFTL